MDRRGGMEAKSKTLDIEKCEKIDSMHIKNHHCHHADDKSEGRTKVNHILTMGTQI